MLPHRPLARATASLAALVVVTVLTACGGGDDENDDTGATSAAATGQPAAAQSDAAEPQPETEDGSAPRDICSAVTAEQVGEALETEGLVADVLPGFGCGFSSDDPRLPSVTLAEVPVGGGNGGFEGFRGGVALGLGGEPETVDGVGDEAFVVTGTVGGGSSVTGSGGVRLGEVAVQVTLLQSSGLSADDVRRLTVAVLTLVADA